MTMHPQISLKGENDTTRTPKNMAKWIENIYGKIEKKKWAKSIKKNVGKMDKKSNQEMRNFRFENERKTDAEIRPKRMSKRVKKR